MRRHSRDDGQATLEAALTLPVVLIALLLIVQVGLVVRDALALHQAAREGVRAAAVSGDDDEASAAVRRSAGPLEASAIDVRVDRDGGRAGDALDVRLSYVHTVSLPVVSRIVSLDLPLRTTATMRAERSTVATPAP